MSRSTHVLFAIIAAAILAGCSSTKTGRDHSISHSPREQVTRVSYDESSYALPIGQPTMLVGRAFIYDAINGGERSGGNVDVVLNPVSAMSTQWFDVVCRRGKVLAGKADPRYAAKAYASKTNSFGQFAFTNVPSGEYYLTTRLYWMDTKPFSGAVQYGGLLAKRIRLAPGTNTINLSDSDKCRGYFH
ncbi:hypothetical protein [Advenella mimigardefordensis]|uniref:Putative membrane protein n=1 Tax=Advenella mimigardefordensis (strain DSM 17166 / LMG 22922 / DPN7) TaxID=1247726 RepID=W0PFV7_ADVMD|nr:hypothetical protein [Advenella mimigardefordensis]AHG64387.1 putative membrane protein [Advenella mimigardefordensis DPN7]